MCLLPLASMDCAKHLSHLKDTIWIEYETPYLCERGIQFSCWCLSSDDCIPAFESQDKASAVWSLPPLQSWDGKLQCGIEQSSQWPWPDRDLSKIIQGKKEKKKKKKKRKNAFFPTTQLNIKQASEIWGSSGAECIRGQKTSYRLD